MLLRAVATAAVAATVTASTVLFGYAYEDATAPNGLALVTSNVQLPIDARVVAWAGYDDASYYTTGWGFLEVHSSSNFTDELQAFAAGFVEGALTVERTFQFISNAFVGSQSYEGALGQYLTDQLAYVKTQVESNPGDAYWHHVGLVHSQLEGLYAGYSEFAAPEQQLPFLMFMSSTIQGDLDDLNVVFSGNAAAVTGDKAARHEVAAGSDGHCSVIVKPVGNPAAPTELYVAHTTWSSFESMTRIYKNYNFPWSITGDAASGAVPAVSMAFSSYPGSLFSDDDFYTLSSGLAVTETTIENNNATLWQYVQPRTVLDWARNMVANRLAVNGSSWAAIFSRENSGTYNNMFHIIDYNLFTPGQPLADNTLWVLEQMPGPYIVASDHTEWLRNSSYWASYNRIADPFLFQLTNQSALVEAFGPHFSWANTSRALIFAREHATVVDEQSLQKLIRYNHFETDPVSTQGCASGARSASNAIAERGDLTSPSAVCCPGLNFQDELSIDGKYTTAAMMRSGKLQSMIQSGPTFDTQPVFVWSNSTVKELSHVGQPEVWNFPWVLASWNLA